MENNSIIISDARLAPAGEVMSLCQGSYWNRSSSGCLGPTAATSVFCGPSEAHIPSHISVPPYLGGLRYGGLGFLRELLKEFCEILCGVSNSLTLNLVEPLTVPSVIGARGEVTGLSIANDSFRRCKR